MGLVIRGSVLALGHQVPLTFVHAKGVTLCENFRQNAMKREESMNLHRRNFLLAVTLATAAATPAFGQVAPTVGAANSGKERATSIPDFSGVWTHSIPGFEPLASGPTALVNRSRRQNGTGNILQLVGDYANPILKPRAAEVVKKHGEIALKGLGDPNPRNQCWPSGVPFVFTDRPTQLVQTPDRITILYGHDHQVRRARLNEPHPARVVPSWYGDSVGHYEGDTLVIDTVGFKIGPFSMIDWYGTPYTQALHVIERYRLLDYAAAKEGFDRDAKQHNPVPGIRHPADPGKYLQLQFTVEDEGTFTMPWMATITYRRALGEWPEVVCADNRHEYYSGRDTAVPTAGKPDF